jgi:hypothetical protein
VNALLVDQCKTNICSDQYYTACSPLSCTYSIEERVSLIYIVTVIIGLYGGLTVALKLVGPLMMETGHYFIRYRPQRID